MKSIEQLRELAGTIEGDLWKPRIVVDKDLNDGWHWRDDAESPRHQWRGPFETERACWLAVLNEYGVNHNAPAQPDPLAAVLEHAEAVYAILCSDLGGDIPARIIAAQEHVSAWRAIRKAAGRT